MPYIETHIEKRPPGNWIGDERIKELGRDNWELKGWGTARDFGGNEPPDGYERYVFQKKVE